MISTIEKSRSLNKKLETNYLKFSSIIGIIQHISQNIALTELGTALDECVDELTEALDVILDLTFTISSDDTNPFIFISFDPFMMF